MLQFGVCVCVYVCVSYRERLYANMEEMYAQVPQEEENPYGFGDETIYDSICYYQRPVSDLVGAVSINMLWVWHIKMQGV